MLFALKSYLTFLIKSTNAHGVHSPFVYDLLTNGLKAHLDRDTKIQLIQHRKALLKDERKIQMTDLGSGSKVFDQKERAVKKIAQIAGMPFSRQKKLVGLCRHLEPTNILELGTSVGLGTAALLFGAPHAKITSVEGCPQTLAIAKEHLKPPQNRNLMLIQERFDRFLETDQKRYDLILLDGDHRKTATLEYFETLLPKLQPNGLLIFDDIHWDEGMTMAWNQLRKDARIQVSIDTFWWGLVAVRSGQRKQHFTLRM